MSILSRESQFSIEKQLCLPLAQRLEAKRCENEGRKQSEMTTFPLSTPLRLPNSIKGNATEKKNKGGLQYGRRRRDGGPGENEDGRFLEREREVERELGRTRRDFCIAGKRIKKCK